MSQQEARVRRVLTMMLVMNISWRTANGRMAAKAMRGKRKLSMGMEMALEVMTRSHWGLCLPMPDTHHW